MEEKQVIDRLRSGEKILCHICKKHFYDVSSTDRKHTNYFHCEDPKCKGYVHIQKAIDVD